MRQLAFWQTPLFATGAALAVLVLLAVVHRLRTRRIKARATLLEAQVDERTDDLRRYARALEEHSHALDRANARIRQTNRFKSEFLANMSHELRTPLNAIIGFSQVLERRLAGRVEEREIGFLHNVLDSGRHLLHLIDNLLDLSKIEAGRMEVHAEDAELRAVVDGVCTIMEGYCRERHITIAPKLPAHLVPSPSTCRSSNRSSSTCCPTPSSSRRPAGRWSSKRRWCRPPSRRSPSTRTCCR
ncbi:MAG TPA: histidine kinase dimerization/phospho-acceptor domain-containing protein [Thermoanaerobaculia bacterium]|nr:histidine kinase dimerization/phospho-acceptor domain-containing protein [Thermoanaerobaculia bacterium]